MPKNVTPNNYRNEVYVMIDILCCISCKILYIKGESHLLLINKIIIIYFIVNGSDFIYMNTSLYGNGTSFVESLFEEFGEFIAVFTQSSLVLRNSA